MKEEELKEAEDELLRKYGRENLRFWYLVADGIISLNTLSIILIIATGIDPVAEKFGTTPIYTGIIFSFILMASSVPLCKIYEWLYTKLALPIEKKRSLQDNLKGKDT